MPIPTAEQLSRCAVAGATASALVTGELLAAGAVQAGSAWAPINAVAPLLLDPSAAEERNWHPAVTPVGLAITLTGLAAWAGLHHLAVSRLPRAARTGTGRAALAALSAGALAVFDYGLLPPARRPRFARWISPAAIAAKYALLAIAMATIHAGSGPEKE